MKKYYILLFSIFLFSYNSYSQNTNTTCSPLSILEDFNINKTYTTSNKFKVNIIYDELTLYPSVLYSEKNKYIVINLYDLDKTTLLRQIIYSEDNQIYLTQHQPHPGLYHLQIKAPSNKDITIK